MSGIQSGNISIRKIAIKDGPLWPLRHAAILAFFAMVVFSSGGCVWMLTLNHAPLCSSATIREPSVWDVVREKADNGDVASQYRVARYYAAGFKSVCPTMGTQSVPVNHEAAYFWFDLVRMSGDANLKNSAEYSMEAEAHYLTYPQMEAQDERAKAWKPVAPLPQSSITLPK